MPPLPNGLDAMRKQRERSRNKPPSRHPRRGGKADNEREQRTGGESGDEGLVPEAPQAEVHGDRAPAEDVVASPPVSDEHVAPDVDGRGVSVGAATDPAADELANRSDAVGGAPDVPSEPAAREPSGERSKARRRQTGAHGGGPVAAVVSLRGEAERKQVEVDALSWAATARRLAEKEHVLRASVEAAVAAGAPAELIVAALVQAEVRGGYQVPPQVRGLAERRRSAR